MPHFACQPGDVFINKMIPNYPRGTWKFFPGGWSALQATPYFVLHFHNTQDVSPHQRLMPILMSDPKDDMTTASYGPARKGGGGRGAGAFFPMPALGPGAGM